MNVKMLLLGALVAFGFSACCEDDASGECICSEIYDPVCGVNGIQYDNPCYAQCAGVDFGSSPCFNTTPAIVLDRGPVASDGCGWVVRFDNIDYHPDMIPPAFLIHELQVTLTYKNTVDSFACGLLPTLLPEIEVVDIN